MNMSQETEFICSHCGMNVPLDFNIGTKNRNHCPKCLYSLHVDDKISGDRRANCGGKMEPIAVTFKQEGLDKYGTEKQGEIMLVHRCKRCGKININRIAGDDDAELIFEIFNQSKDNINLANKLKEEGVALLDDSAETEVKKQLFGPK